MKKLALLFASTLALSPVVANANEVENYVNGTEIHEIDLSDVAGDKVLENVEPETKWVKELDPTQPDKVETTFVEDKTVIEQDLSKVAGDKVLKREEPKAEWNKEIAPEVVEKDLTPKKDEVKAEWNKDIAPEVVEKDLTPKKDEVKTEWVDELAEKLEESAKLPKGYTLNYVVTKEDGSKVYHLIDAEGKPVVMENLAETTEAPATTTVAKKVEAKNEAKATLPNTGETTTLAGLALATLSVVAGAFLVSPRFKKEN